MKLKALRPATSLEKTPTQRFSSEYCKIFKNIYLVEHLQLAASVHPMLSTALQPTFHRALAFVQWHFVLVEKCQIKFFMTETSHSKSILSNIPSVLYVTWCVLQRFNFTPRDVLSYRFCWCFYCTEFSKESKPNFFAF